MGMDGADPQRAAYSLDTIAVETTFMIAPAAGIFVSTQLSSTVALSSIGVAFGLVAIGLIWMNPPIRNVEETPSLPEDRPPPRTWMTGRLAAALLIAWITVLSHALRVARANPIHALRYE